MVSTAFTAKEFWKMFPALLKKRTKRRLIIHCPYATIRRVMFLIDTIGFLTRNRVTVCVFLELPEDWFADPEKLPPKRQASLRSFRLAIEALLARKVHVTLRPFIHQKIIVSDDDFMIEGSMNCLSHARTYENMRLWESKEEVRIMIEKHELDSCSACNANHSKYVLTSSVTPSQRWGKLLSFYRKKLKLSKRGLASLATVSRDRITDLEDGKSVGVDACVRMLRAVGFELLLVPQLTVPTVSDFLSRLDETDCKRGQMQTNAPAPAPGKATKA